jgi:hypothetical protein
VRSAVSAFAHSLTKPEVLRDAVLDTFHAVELLLKMRLEPIDPAGLKENNPTILRRLIDHGVAISASEVAHLTSCGSSGTNSSMRPRHSATVTQGGCCGVLSRSSIGLR